MAFDVLAFHERAVQTSSHESVEDMRSLLVETLEDAGVEVTVDEGGNVVARRGVGENPDDDGTHLLLNTHLDTVPPHIPYERDGEIVRGRGACDAKGPLAAMVGAFLGADVGDGRVTLGITPDEETTQTGAAHLAETLDAFDAAVIGEPTGLDVCHAARGQFEGQITLRGESAHASDPSDGTNAVRAIGPTIEAMDRYDEAHGIDTHDTLGSPTLTPTMVEGGEAPNQIPAAVTVTFDRRSVPPERSGEFPASLEAHLRESLPDEVGVDVSLVRPDTPFPEAFETDPDAHIVEVLRAASGGSVRPFGAATEAAQFAASAPTVVFGPGMLSDDEGPVAHSPREYVDRRDVRRASEVLTEAVDVALR